MARESGSVPMYHSPAAELIGRVKFPVDPLKPNPPRPFVEKAAAIMPGRPRLALVVLTNLPEIVWSEGSKNTLVEIALVPSVTTGAAARSNKKLFLKANNL